MGRIATLAAVLTLLAPASAIAAARTVAPPGNSEADQYFQTLPGSAGPRTPDPTGTPQGAVREGSLTASAARGLAARGETGRALADAVARTAPPRGSRVGRGSEPPAEASGSLGSPGMSTAFPLILVATAAAAAGFALARRRRPRPR